ncbi:unnamed protein product [Ectocarpus sp. CCAP 1310/34]|nr:unnamed protein product [Ectocarpus sp. CCAP 1310/34]
MRGPPWSAGTRMFSSVDDSSDSSDTSSECWNPRSPGEHSIGSRPSGGDVSPSKLALPALATALRASRARAAAAQAKASRLLEETGRLRDALKVARKGEERANRCETELAKSEARARELESDNRRIRRDLDGARLRNRQNEAKARSSLSILRTSLEGLEQEQRARCKRWRATTRSQRALLESLRRHVQRGHHSAPSFTAFQLIEQIFGCLKTLESDAQLSPARRRQRSPSAACSPLTDPSPPRRGGSPKRSPHAAVAAAAAGPRVTVKGLTPTPSSVSDRLDDEEDPDLRTGRGTNLPAAIGIGGGGGGLYFSSDGDGSGVDGSSGSQEEFQTQEGGGGRTTARFSTEWAYRLAVTKLTAQLKAARERLHGEKEAARSAGERVEQLELEVEGLSSKVAAADGHRRRLEAMLKETKRERDALRALSAALGILHQRQASSSPAYPPAPQPPPPPPPTAFSATPQAPTAPTPQAPAVYPATVSEALYDHGGGAPRLEPRALAAARSRDGGSGGGWWEGGEGTGVEPRYGQRHQPQQHTAAPDTGDGFMGSPAPAVRGGAGREPPRSARHAESAGVGGRELLTRSEIQRIVDDAVMNGTGRRGTGDGGGGDDVAGVGGSHAAGAELPGVGYRWRDTSLGFGSSSLLDRGGGGGGGGRRSAAAAAAAAAPTAAASCSGRRRDTAWLSSRPPATAIGRTPAERGIVVGAARVGGPPPRPKATNSDVGGGKNGGGGSVSFGGGSSLGPRAVTREDLTRLDNEIANLSKTVEQLTECRMEVVFGKKRKSEQE